MKVRVRLSRDGTAIASRTVAAISDAVSGDRADDALQATAEPRLGVRPS